MAIQRSISVTSLENGFLVSVSSRNDDYSADYDPADTYSKSFYAPDAVAVGQRVTELLNG
jgi:hypothetical protein